jgi:hypothetical protein
MRCAVGATGRAGKKRRGRKKREGKREGFLAVWSMHSLY